MSEEGDIPRSVQQILKEFPFSGRYSDRQEDVLATFLFEKIGGTRKRAYERAGVSETAAISIEDAFNELTAREKTRLLQYLATRYEEVAEDRVKGDSL